MTVLEVPLPRTLPLPEANAVLLALRSCPNHGCGCSPEGSGLLVGPSMPLPSLTDPLGFFSGLDTEATLRSLDPRMGLVSMVHIGIVPYVVPGR